MLKKLSSRKLVRKKGGKTLLLTEEGERRALTVLRKHRLAKRFLVDHLGISWGHAHEQACRWEHVLSDEVTDALEEFLGVGR